MRHRHRWTNLFLILCSLCLLGVLVLLAGGPLSSQQATEPTVKVPEPLDPTDPYWTQARREVYKGVEELLKQHQVEIDRGLKYHKLFHGDLAKKQIALTFDDGPHPKFTPQLLRVLKKQQVPATFFVVGELAAQHPDLIKAEIKAGHTVGNHTYHHVNLTKIVQVDVATEMKACGDVLERITGVPPHYFRPPGGDYDKTVAEAADALGYVIVLWTDDPGDYASPGKDVIVKRIKEQLGDGGILLLHDGIQQTIDILPGLIKDLKKQGYTFVTVEEMMRGK